jgi:hypothetical protein
VSLFSEPTKLSGPLVPFVFAIANSPPEMQWSREVIQCPANIKKVKYISNHVFQTNKTLEQSFRE